jgi:hypothetical protein
MTRLTTLFPAAARLSRRDDEWDVFRQPHTNDVDPGDAYLGSVWLEDGEWWACHAIHEYKPGTGLRFSTCTDPVLIPQSYRPERTPR